MLGSGVMIYTYNELIEKKNNGEVLEWDTISKEQLESLFFGENITDSLLADLYDVSKNRVRYKRDKLDVKMGSIDYYKNLYKEYMSVHPELELIAKENLLQEHNISVISKAITHYIFRNGPIEDMHHDGKFSQNDMKVLNKFMVNRIAGLLKLCLDGEWTKLELMLETLRYCGSSWDEVEFDTEEIDEIFKLKVCNK